MKFTKYIKSFLNEEGMNIKELANSVNLARPYVTLIVNGKRVASSSFLKKFYKRFSISKDEQIKIEKMVAQDFLTHQADRLNVKMDTDYLIGKKTNYMKILKLEKDKVKSEFKDELFGKNQLILNLENDIFEFKKNDFVVLENISLDELENMNGKILYIDYKDKKVFKEFRILDKMYFLRSSFSNEDTVILEKKDINDVMKPVKLIREIE